VALGAQVVSNSYGGRETGQALAYAAAYQHAGHVIVASSGDAGFTAASYPAVLGGVVAVGGTELEAADNARGFTESVWNGGYSGAGSDCSAYVAKPSWQHDTHSRTAPPPTCRPPRTASRSTTPTRVAG
jgi:hypothetical protein